MLPHSRPECRCFSAISDKRGPGPSDRRRSLPANQADHCVQARVIAPETAT
jgi:hypothetical protein